MNSSQQSNAPQHQTIDYELIEAFFFAYRDFISDPDKILEEFDFGRAHHRVLHFVNRKPGLTVAELLDILKITKQSLARVLKQLIDGGYIEQKTSPQDRRQRHLLTTLKGQELSLQLSVQQSKRLTKALQQKSKEERKIIIDFLNNIIDIQ